MRTNRIFPSFPLFLIVLSVFFSGTVLLAAEPAEPGTIVEETPATEVEENTEPGTTGATETAPAEPGTTSASETSTAAPTGTTAGNAGATTAGNAPQEEILWDSTESKKGYYNDYFIAGEKPELDKIETVLYYYTNKKGWVEQHVNALQDTANYLVYNSDMGVLVKGFADPSGSYKYNYKLSAQRANRVRNGLIWYYNVPGDRIKVEYKGEKSGKGPYWKRRRVELHIMPLDQLFSDGVPPDYTVSD